LAEVKNISSGLAQELSRFVQNGGSLVVFPAAETDMDSYQSFLSSLGTNYYLKIDTANTKIDWVNFESDIFSDVFDKPSNGKMDNMDLPVVHNHFTQTQSSQTNREVLLKIKNGESFFSKYTFKKGKVYLSSVTLNSSWSNLAKHAIFVPLMYKIAMNSQPAEELFYTVGQNNSIKATAKLTGENVFKIKGNGPSYFEIIPETRVVDLQPTIFVHDQIKDAGNYHLISGNERAAGISFNYDRKESDLKRYSPDELIALSEKEGLSNFSLIDVGDKNVSVMLADIGEGKKLWKWCILFALIFLAAETALLRWFRS